MDSRPEAGTRIGARPYRLPQFLQISIKPQVVCIEEGNPVGVCGPHSRVARSACAATRSSNDAHPRLIETLNLVPAAVVDDDHLDRLSTLVECALKSGRKSFSRVACWDDCSD